MATQNDGSPSPRTEAEEIQSLPLQRGVGLLGLGGVQVSANDSNSEGVGPKTLKLYAKLWKIHATIERIEKDKRNEQGNYRYASEKAIKDIFHPLLVEYGLIIVPRQQELISFIPPSGGKSSNITNIRCVFAIVDLETGAELVMEQLASGGDTLDKGTFKAITGALKYVLTTLFLIPTGDDVEASDRPKEQRQAPQARPVAPRGQQDPSAVITEPQTKRIFALANKAGKTNEQVKAIIVKAGYNSSKEILAKDYDSICAAVEAR